MMDLKIISGIIFAVLGFIGTTVVLFYSSSAVTGLFIFIGAAGFGSLFMYGVWTGLDAYLNALIEFQVNN